MENIFVEFLPPWVETGIQPAFYDKESGSVLQQTARMYARVNMLIRMFNKLSKNTKEEIETFEHDVNETVDEYIEKFNELYNYVHDYFDNLDVQEEINNKLDDMVEQGTLQPLIDAAVIPYVNLNATLPFETVASMKSADTIVNGSTVMTLGFYTKGDGGDAIYKVREKEENEVLDEMTKIAIGDDLVADLIYDDTISVKKLGAKGDGSNNDTSAITKAISICNKVILPNGVYLVNSGFTLKNNLSIIGEKNTTIKQADGSNITNIFTGSGTQNLLIKNIKIDLNIDNQSYSDRANQGRGVLVTSSGSNLTFDNFSTSRIYGTFIYLTDSTYITTVNCIIGDPDGAYSAYGIFVVRCQHILCENCEFSGVRVYGTSLSSYGFYAKDSCLDVLVVKNRFTKMQCLIDGSKSNGTATYSTSVKIIDNVFTDTPGDTTIRYSKYGLMSHNITRGSGDFGLSVGNSEFISVDNNVVEGSNTVGIGLRISSQCSVTNNTIINPCQNFRGLDLVANQRDGIYVIGNSRRCIITSNNIMDNNSPAKMYSAIAIEDVSGGTPGADDSFAVICNNSTYGSSSGTAIRAENTKNIIDNNYIPS